MVLNTYIVIVIPNCCSTNIATFTYEKVSFTYSTSLQLTIFKKHLLYNRQVKGVPVYI